MLSETATLEFDCNTKSKVRMGCYQKLPPENFIKTQK